MNSNSLFNNVAIEALSIAFVLAKTGQMPLSKALLIPPIVAHKELLNHLARSTTNILSFEKYFIENLPYFSNFNRRFYSELVTSANAIQLLCELKIVELQDSKLHLIGPLTYDKKMGKRTEKISKAAPNISALLDGKLETLYLNLRIEL